MTRGRAWPAAAGTWLVAHGPQAVVAAFAAGLALGPHRPSAAWLLPLGAAIAVLRVPRLGLLVAAALVAGLVAGESRIEAIDGPGSQLRDGAEVAGRAELTAAPRSSPSGPWADLRMASGAASGARLRARLPRGWNGAGRVEVGELLRVRGSFRAVSADRGAEFDYAAFLRRRGIAGELDVSRVTGTGSRRHGIAGLLDVVRRRADAGLVAGLPGPSAALARGMVLGDDSAIDAATEEDYRRSGLAHLLAVSGLNVVLLVALATPLLVLASVGQPARAVVVGALIVLYVPLAGGGPSIQRAGAMGLASLAAVQLSRPASRWHALILACAATLLLDPRAWLDPGWQLSFAAVVGIVLIAAPLARRLGALPRAAAEGVAVTVAATLATAPLLAHHFGAVSLAALPANVAALPLVAPIMWIGMLRSALGVVGWWGGWPSAAADAAIDGLRRPLTWLLDGLTGLAAAFSDIPGAQVELALGHPAAVLAGWAALALLCAAAVRWHRRVDTRLSACAAYLRRLPTGRRAAFAAVFATVAALALARGLAPAPPPGVPTITFLDVGQGDAVLVQHPAGGAVLFDGGPPEGGVARLLRRAGVRRLSALVLTHASRDHHGGLGDVVERYPIEVVVDGGDGTRDRSFAAVVDAAVARGARRVVAAAPLSLTAGRIAIRLLAPGPRPPGPPPEDPNPRAAVAHVRVEGLEALLSADAESPSLLGLDLPDVDLLKLPHHGSADEGLPELLDRLRPEAAAITVGENSYGHPAPSTLSALGRAGVPAWRTDIHGTVRVSLTPSGLRIDPERGTVAAAP